MIFFSDFFLIPKKKKKVLGKLMGMLHKVSEKSEINKMTPANLAIVFGQNLLRTDSADLMKVLFFHLFLEEGHFCDNLPFF